VCGICGKVGLTPESKVDATTVDRMTRTLAHRGPDDMGLYASDIAVLGHTRLSIIDLSSGKQPICNETRTVWIVFNGEIYNFKELRKELIAHGHIFSTNTDTEVIVHLYEQFGEAAIPKLRGMFAFALWDSNQKALVLARDRVGIKPLYYTIMRDHILFGSEIKSLLADPSVPREPDPGVIDTFLSCLYTPGDATLLRGIRKLPPGHYLVLKNGRIDIRRYWDLEFNPNPQNGNVKRTTEELVELLRESVRDHMISDVPVGVLLSGGVDSTGVLSFAAEESGRDLNTFTIGFEGEAFADERVYARLAANTFGTRHYEMTITPRQFRDFLPLYVWHMEEPVCEPPAVALYYVTKLAREHVKVLLSGEGGDEAFAGYQNYRNMLWLERLKVFGEVGNGFGSYVLGQFGRVRGFEKLTKYSFMMKNELEQYYYSRTAGPYSFFNASKGELYSKEFASRLNGRQVRNPVSDYFSRTVGKPALNKMLYVDTKTWLPDDLLLKADKITMANSVELRVPLLDHRVLEFAARLPAKYKVNYFTTKYLLKKALKDRIPSAILNRKKMGFPVPLESWLKEDLRDYVCEILLDRRTLERGYFDKSFLQTLANEHARTADHATEMFSLLTLELWHRTFIDSPATHNN